ncbi:hypothetical protein MMC19_001802 [Ptychographa xylographoides]|nr:hypothetical protein [Ptychographa xylographoides]
MVSTRNHPSNFPPPTESPSKSLTRTTRDTDSATPTNESSSPPPTASKAKAKQRARPAARKSDSGPWSHTPSNLTLIWLAISLPLVIWDTGYVLLRPYSMPGGSLHWPLWVPYKLYGEVDHIYGFPAFNAKNGFTSGQGSMNVVETLGYMAYLWIVFRFGRPTPDVEGRGAPSPSVVGWLGEARTVGGREAGVAVLIAFSTALMTVSKTVLYWLSEYFSGFGSIGHNDALSLVFLWIIPNGAWLVFPGYMMYVLGQEMLEAMAVASGNPYSQTSLAKVLAIKDE